MNDQQVIKKFLDKTDKGEKIYVDIGSSYESNLPKEIIKDGNKTLFFEMDSIKASAWKNDHNFEIINQKVTPNNVYDLIFEKISKDSEITFIDIDIDGYDFHVLNNLLQKTRPFLITAEINEKIPPPIKFSVKYNDNYFFISYNRIC